MRKFRRRLKQTVKDVGMFGAGSLTLGASARAVAPFGSSYGAGLSTMGSMMPSVGSAVMLKNQVGLMSSALDVLPKPRRRWRKR